MLFGSGSDVNIDRFAKFYDYLVIEGWFHGQRHDLIGLEVRAKSLLLGCGGVQLPSPDLCTLPPNRRFRVSLLLGGAPVSAIELHFRLTDGSVLKLDYEQILAACSSRPASANPAYEALLKILKDPAYGAVLEIGSRARSGISRRHLLEGKRYVGLDILHGVNVDVVCDAHAICFSQGSFDAVFAIATFEHLLMPWKVALEINRVLRGGGIAFLHTHQALGLHDLPWDFWRYSASAWHALFNRATGFEVLITHMGDPMHLVPFFYWDHWEGAERSVGFATSSVLVRKVSEPRVRWDATPQEALPAGFASYPF